MRSIFPHCGTAGTVLLILWATAGSTRDGQALGAEPSEAMLRANIISGRAAVGMGSPSVGLRELGHAYRALFREVGADGLVRLERDDDTAIALQAAWARNFRFVPRPAPPDPPGRSRWTISPAHLQR